MVGTPGRSGIVEIDEVSTTFPRAADHALAHEGPATLTVRRGTRRGQHDERLLPFRRAMDAGLLTAADPVVAAASMWATCHGVVSLERRDVGQPGLDWDPVYRTTTAASMAGLVMVR